MDQKKIERINELARLAKTRALTPEETAERRALREEYIQAYRASLMSQLDSMVIQRPDGTREHLKRRGGIH
ncbi:MAG: DUF896 domain-containing protein [Candidatus Fimadaptatus sp.]